MPAFSLPIFKGPCQTAGALFFCARGAALSLQRSRARGDGAPAMMRGWCKRQGHEALLGRIMQGPAVAVMQRKRAFPRPAQRCGGVMTVVADSLHSGKGQDQAALLAEKRKDRLLQVPAKKKECSPGRRGASAMMFQ